MKSFIRCLFLFAFLLLNCGSFSQSVYFRNYSVEHGLPFIQAQTIFQDSKGFIWTGGYGGLSRFDGTGFQNFSPRDGLVNHAVTAITEDKNNVLWIGTMDGLSSYDGKTFKNYTSRDGLPSNNIYYLTYDKDYLYIGTAEGISRFDGKSFLNYPVKDGQLPGIVYCVYRDKENTFWLGAEKGLLKFSNTLSEIRSPITSRITSISEDKNGLIFIGTVRGLYTFNRKSEVIELLSARSGLPEVKINALTVDRKGYIWAGTDDGVYRIMQGKAKKYSIGSSVNNNLVASLMVDHESNLWIGTNNGLFKYRDDQFLTYGIEDGLRSSFIYQIFRDRSGLLWVCTTNGVHTYDGKSFRVFTEKDGLPSSNTLAVTQDSSGNIWVGTDKGLARFKNKRFQSFNRASGLLSDSATALTIDSKGILWVGGQNSIASFDGKEFVSTRLKKNSKKEFSVWKILEVSPGNFIIGTYQGGLLSFDGREARSIEKDLKIEQDVFLDVVKDNDGIFYFATFQGVLMYIPEEYPNKRVQRIVKFDEAAGLSSDLVYCLSFDRDKKNLWVGTNQGVNKINVEGYKHSGKKQIISYGKEDGFMGVELNSGGIFVEDDNSVWFGTVNGLIRHNPYNYIPNTSPPRVNLTSIRLFYKDTLLQNGAVLDHDQNHLSFNYVAGSYSNPAKVKYRIKLEGFDKSWSPVTTLHTATYSNLSPGKYELRIIASNNEGVWSREPLTFSFEITKPWWTTWWFRTALATFIVVSLTVGFRLRTQQIRRKERELASRNLEVARLELTALRSQMNPHFIFNSLNSIQHFILQSNEVSAVKYLNKFARLIRVILNNSEKNSITLREELEALQLYLELEELRFSEKFGFRITVDKNVDLDYHEVPPLILQPYVENAILHGLNPKPGKGLLEVKISMKGAYIICSVTDNGIGRKQAMRLREDSIKASHVSHGTRITRQRLEILNKSFHSELSVNISDLEDSEESSGTKVDVYIPV